MIQGNGNFNRRTVKLNGACKQDVNNTPIRQRDFNKENHKGHQNKGPESYHTPISYIERDSTSPYSQESSISNSRTVPKRRASVAGRACTNHPEVEAQFKIEIDEENLNYCSKCAVHLASSGFKVEKILPNKSPRRVKEVLRSPAYSRRRQELGHFIQTLKELERGYEEKEDHLAKIQQSHEIEKETISNFYCSLFEYLEYIRDEHLNFMDEEAKRSAQICEIEADEIGETMEELRGMREDIEGNVDKIVEEVDHSSYLECMTYYSQKKEIHEQRLEELGIDARAASCTTSDCVDEKLRQFKFFIDDLTGILSSKAEPPRSY